MAKKKPGGSLRDQLKQAGLVTEKQARKAEKGAHRKSMRVTQGVETDEVREAALRARAEKADRDREANRARDHLAAEKAVAAQIRQLIASNAQRERGDVEYHFTDSRKVKKIYVSKQNQQQLNRGFLAVVQAGDSYELVPEKVARKIMERDANIVKYLYERDADAPDEDDPYKDFPIPDDLDW